MPDKRPFTAAGQGLTFIEILIVLAVIISLAGILAPFVADEIDRAAAREASAEVQMIADGLRRYVADTGLFPTGDFGQKGFRWLSGDGIPPYWRGDDGEPRDRLDAYLVTGDRANDKWKGPYLNAIPPDPWGRAYVVYVAAYFRDDEGVWVLSAGENGLVETHGNDPLAQGDDVAVRID
jgi:type II secretory pathway pseudopilin PulG